MVLENSHQARPFMTKQTFDGVSAVMWGQNALDYHANYIVPRAHWDDCDIRDEAIYFAGVARGLRLGGSQKSSQPIGNSPQTEYNQQGHSSAKFHPPTAPQNKTFQVYGMLPPSENVRENVSTLTSPQQKSGGTTCGPAQPSPSTQALSCPKCNDTVTNPHLIGFWGKHCPPRAIQPNNHICSTGVPQITRHTPAPVEGQGSAETSGVASAPDKKHLSSPTTKKQASQIRASTPLRHRASQPPSASRNQGGMFALMNNNYPGYSSDEDHHGIPTPSTQWSGSDHGDFDESMEMWFDEQEAKKPGRDIPNSWK